MSLEALNQNTMQRITVCRDTIEKLHNQFQQMIGVQYYKEAHEITCSFLISEYIQKLKIPSVNDNTDSIFLCARRLLEVFITLKYLSQTNTFPKMIEYCQRDRYEYLKGCKARIAADEKFFPELKDLDNYALEDQEEQKEIIKRYNEEIFEKCNEKEQENLLEDFLKGKLKKSQPKIELPALLPDMRKMAIAIGYEVEYIYFYKFTSKILHFCPFSLNGDAYFEHAIHKVVFLIRIAKYLEEIAKELEHIYQSVPSPS